MTADPGLVAHVESPLPAAVAAGSATAAFCYGICLHPEHAIADLRIAVDGERHGVAALRMPRPDVALGRSGFWATVPLPARGAGSAIELRADARLVDGRELSAPLASIAVVEPPPPPAVEPGTAGAPAPAPAAGDGPPVIAVCMATHEPDMALLRVQVESLRAQTDERWICLVSDDCSSPARFAAIRDLVGADPRFALSRSEARLGFYRNFERALRMVPAGVELVALCDQDDRWHPGKLAVLRAALGGARLAYSDQRLVDRDGRVLRATLWRGRRNNASNLASMLVANTITGAATLFRRDVADLALPFPDTPGLEFHDHWLALVALATGDVAYVDRPLYDYVQHAGAIFGDVTEHGERRPAPRVLDRWRAAYFCGYVAREVLVRTLLARGAGRIAPRKRAVLGRYLASARSPLAFAWLAARPLRRLAGRTETLGSEADLARGLAWRWLAAHAPDRVAGDARLPA
ncbi:MAG TPA: glycosyltransferase, partial [Solirubrobacteraceae bacterium]|nr:glycosyltransferase [Solirubrobacteraceae bacterium]